jgi:hypothetical protein
VEKYGTARQVTDDSVIRHTRFACWITEAADNTLRICNTYCFCTATIVARTRLDVNVTRTLSALFVVCFVSASNASFSCLS